MNYKDYYEILKIERKASDDEIKRAYRRLAKIYHPDSNPNDEEAEARIRDINEAYGVLSDKAKRRKYDILTNDSHFWENLDLFGLKKKKKKKQQDIENKEEPTNIFSDFFNVFFSDDSITLDEFFETTRGTSRKSRRKFVEKQYEIKGLKGVSVEVELKITLEEAFNGATKKVKVMQLDRSMKEYKIEVPKGIKDGEKIRLTGLGFKNSAENSMGDLYVKVLVEKHKDFELQGNDIHTKICLAPWEAILGDKVQFKGISGNMIDIKIPKGIQTGKVLKLKEQGFWSKEGRGDMYLEIVIVVPPKPTTEELALFECLKSTSKFNARDVK